MASKALSDLAQQPLVRFACAASIGAGLALWISGRTQKLMEDMVAKAAESVNDIAEVSKNVKETAGIMKSAIELPHMADLISFMSIPVADDTFRWEGQYNMVIDIRESLVVIKDIFNSPSLREHLERLCPVKGEAGEAGEGTKGSDAASLAAAQAAIEGANKPMLCAKCTDPVEAVEAALSAAPPAQEVDSGEQVRNVRSILEDFRAITESEVSLRWSNLPALLQDEAMQMEFVRLVVYVVGLLLLAAIAFAIAFQIIF